MGVGPSSGRQPITDPPQFGTTSWTLIVSSAKAATDGDAESRRALSELCRIYWRPIFAFLCRRGYSIADAQDLTQDFFIMVLNGRLLRGADPQRGRFRSLLLKALQHFLIDEREKRSALKRGGSVEFVSWDDWMAEAPSQLSVPARVLDSWTPERLFDVRWAATVVERSLARLREECQARGRGRVFDVLSTALSADRADVCYEQLATALGVAEPAVKRLLHQLRQRYRTLLREEVAQTVEAEADVEDEIRYLCSVLAAGTQLKR